MKLVATLVAVGLIGAPFFARAEDMKPGTPMDGMDMTTSGEQSKADAEFSKANSKMMSDMDVKTTGKPDVDFVRMMMPHHQGAVDMAKIELRYGTDPMLRKMAQDIVSSQDKELTEMKEWQTKNDK